MNDLFSKLEQDNKNNDKKLNDFSLEAPSSEVFHYACYTVKDEFWGVRYNLNSMTGYVLLKPFYTEIARIYFISNGNKFPTVIIKRLCEKAKILPGHILKKGRSLELF